MHKRQSGRTSAECVVLALIKGAYPDYLCNQRGVFWVYILAYWCIVD